MTGTEEAITGLIVGTICGGLLIVLPFTKWGQNVIKEQKEQKKPPRENPNDDSPEDTHSVPHRDRPMISPDLLNDVQVGDGIATSHTPVLKKKTESVPTE